MFQLVLFLDGVTVGATLGGVNDLVTETLCDRLDIPEGSLTSPGAQEPDGLVNPPQWRDVHNLTSDCSSPTNSCGIFTRSGVDDSIDHDLQWVLSSPKMNYLEAVLDDPHSHQLLAIVPSVHHQRVDQTLHNRALSFTETLCSVPASRVRKKLGILLLNCDVVRQ